MALTETLAATESARLGSIPASNKHCVFRCGDSWFSVPAVAVREIVMAPEMVRVPNCHRALAGLGHVRSDFVPVISLGTLLGIDQAGDAQPGTGARSSAQTGSSQARKPASVDCLLVFGGSCIWSLLISESAALESMETFVSQDSGADNSNNVVMGTAMFQQRIVRVLNPNGLLAAAQQAFDQYWRRNDH